MPLCKKGDYGVSKFVGLEVQFIAEIQEALQDAVGCKFDFLIAPLISEKAEIKAQVEQEPANTFDAAAKYDQLLQVHSGITSSVIGLIRYPLLPFDPPDDWWMRDDVTRTVRYQFMWALHHSIPIVAAPLTGGIGQAAMLAQGYSQALEKTVMPLQLWLRVPLRPPSPPQRNTSSTATCHNRLAQLQLVNQLRMQSGLGELQGINAINAVNGTGGKHTNGNVMNSASMDTSSNSAFEGGAQSALQQPLDTSMAGEGAIGVGGGQSSIGEPSKAGEPQRADMSIDNMKVEDGDATVPEQITSLNVSSVSEFPPLGPALRTSISNTLAAHTTEPQGSQLNGFTTPQNENGGIQQSNGLAGSACASVPSSANASAISSRQIPPSGAVQQQQDSDAGKLEAQIPGPLKGPAKVDFANMDIFPEVSGMMSSAPDQGVGRVDGGQADMGLGQDMRTDSWQWWNTFRQMVGQHEHLGVVLDIPTNLDDPSIIDRWIGEPTRAVILNTECFITNSQGYPVLPKSHQELIWRCFKHQIQVIISGEIHHENVAPMPASGQIQLAKTASAIGTKDDADIAIIKPTNRYIRHRVYLEYLQFLFRKLPKLSDDYMAAMNYFDYLQSPLQPLRDNLEFTTYETFERDTIKYTQYEEAIRLALESIKVRQGALEQIKVMVVGSGRGPLVDAAIRAKVRAKVNVKIHAVEKNPHAVVYLQKRAASEEKWRQLVTVVPADMRRWNTDLKADVLVSELLGSFGDNELSPECLDGAQRFLAPGGISIPADYTSYLAPITTVKLHNDLRTSHDKLKNFETSYVVKLHRHTRLADPQPVFVFEHPVDLGSSHNNRRYKQLAFDLDESIGGSLVHGFGGYFHTTLFGDVDLSTNPQTHTPNMFSWFPIYFPLETPIQMDAGARIVVHMWRCVEEQRVWYEWMVTEPSVSKIHNTQGRGHAVGL